VFSRQALAYLKSGNPAWIPMVPPAVAEVIRKNGYFGWKKDP
jgi:uncharacterized protein (UPF0297 family)